MTDFAADCWKIPALGRVLSRRRVSLFDFRNCRIPALISHTTSVALYNKQVSWVNNSTIVYKIWSLLSHSRSPSSRKTSSGESVVAFQPNFPGFSSIASSIPNQISFHCLIVIHFKVANFGHFQPVWRLLKLCFMTSPGRHRAETALRPWIHFLLNDRSVCLYF